MKTFRKIAILFLLVSLMNFGASNIEGKIAQIRKDFESTNAVKNYVIKEVEDSEQSTDGGVVKYYLQNGIVKKIVVEHFGESWNSLTEYYVKNGKVYFIFDKSEKYNVPYYYVDSKWYKENKLKNGEVFDKRKSKFSEQRYYFDENKKIVENGQKLKEIEKDILNEYYRIKN